MKVIFLEDLPKVAFAGEVKEVADGYARNYLIPKKIAVIAKPGAINVVAARQVKVVNELTELAVKLEGVEVNLTARAGTKERLYGSITAADIASELHRITGLDVDKRKLDMDKPIHQLGSYEIAIRLAKDISPKIKVNVASEGGELAQDEAAEETAKPAQAAVAEETEEPPQDAVAEETEEPPQDAAAEEAEDPAQAAAAEETEEPPQAAAAEEAEEPPDETKSGE
ncbi:50S ribosomal protein L9 [Chloroflexota bacterium]